MKWTLATLSTAQSGTPAYVGPPNHGALAGRVGAPGSKRDTYIRYYHTLRFLRPVQVYGRAWHKLAPQSRVTASPAPARRRTSGPWIGGAQREQTLLAPTTFRFLHRTIDIAKSEGRWNLTCAPEKLWLLNLHYFDDLNATSASQRIDWHRDLIADWIENNPPTQGIGWGDAYAVSLRVVNWVKWELNGNVLSTDALQSLATQVRHLEDNLETYLLGNHVLANAKALIFAGAFFQGPEADRWRRRGLQLLERELREEILADGGHYERSPMYHCIILEDLLDLFQLTRVFPEGLGGNLPDQLETTTTAMRSWLKAMSHPDGEISFFNDSAIGIAPNSAALEVYANRLGHAPVADMYDGMTHLAKSGYIRWQKGSLCAIVDVGEIGPDHIPGHAHADTLSFELSLFGHRTLVNSGTSAYKIEPTRQLERGTAAHNTVIVDGFDSSEVWSAFRVARRARPKELKIRATPAGLLVEAAHDGYMRLPGHVMHNRSFFFGEHKVGITDVLTGDFEHAEARYHFHPSALDPGANAAKSRAGSRSFGSVVCSARFEKAGDPEGPGGYVEPYLYHPGFGMDEPSQCIVLPIAPRPDRMPTRTQFSMTWD